MKLVAPGLIARVRRISRTILPVATIVGLAGIMSAPLQAQQFVPFGPLSFTKAFNGADPLPQTFTVISAGASFNFSRNVTTITGGSWLSVANLSFNNCGLCPTPQNLRVNVVANPSLAPGTYTGQIVLTSQNNVASITIPVSLTVAPAASPSLGSLPGQVSFSLETNGLTPPSHAIDVRNGGSGTLNWTLAASTADGGAWLGVSATSGAAPSTVNVSLVKQNLPGQGTTPGIFIGKLTFQGAGASVTIPVIVTVGENVFRQINGISFTKPFNGANPLPQTLTAASTGTDFQFTVSESTSTGGDWLSLDNVSFNNCGICSTPQNIRAIVAPGPTLAVGTYTGQIVFTSRDGTQSITVPVTLTITAPDTPFFDNLPGQLSFSLRTGAVAPPTQPVEARNGGTGSLSWTASASTADGGDWLNISVSNGTAPSVIQVGLSEASLPNGGLVLGTFIGQIVFQSMAGTVTVPVIVTVSDSAFRQVNPINFTKVFGGLDPLSQTLTIASTGDDFQFTVSASTASGGSWLTIDNPSFNACGICSTPQNLRVSAHPNITLAAGSYTGQVVVTSRDGQQSLTIPVTLTVADATAPSFENLPGQMSFFLQTGGTAPPSQSLQIRNHGPGTLNWTLQVSTSDGGAWLNATPLSGAAPSTVNVSISKQNLPDQGLTPSTFNGSLVFTSSSGTVTVPVSVTVGADIFKQVNGIAFNKVLGGSDPLFQTLTIPSSGANFQFTVSSSTANGGAWLTVANPSFNACGICSTPQTFRVSAHPSPTLGAGLYTGQVVCTSRDGRQTMTVPVSLTITDPAAPSFDDLPGQLSFSLQTGGVTPPSKSFQIRNRGGGTLDWTLAASTSDGGNWLSVSATSGAAPSTPTISILKQNLPGQGLLAGHFVGNIVLRSSNSSVTIPVSVIVRDDAFRQVDALSFNKAFNGTDPLSQTMFIPSTGENFQFTFTANTGNGGNWLVAENVSFNGCGLCGTPFTLRVSARPSPTLAAGTYTGQVVITARDGSQAMTVPVSLTILNATDPYFDDLPGQMSFSFSPGSGNPPARSLEIRNAGGGTLGWTLNATTSDGGNWLNVAPASGSAPSTVNVSVNAGALPGLGLVAGFFNGEIVIQGPGSSVSIPVAVYVAADVFVQLGRLNFAKPVAGTNPPPQVVHLASTGAEFQFTVDDQTGKGGDWLSLTTQRGCSVCSTPSDVSISVIASSTLPAGVYTGQVIATSRNAVVSMTIPVILTVGTPTPAITAVAPNTGQTGQTLASVSITGTNTHFVQGTTTANFGAGITVNSLTVNSGTSAMANISIAANAATGARNVTLTTGSEVATQVNGFTVAGGPSLQSVTPNNGEAGQTIGNVAIVGLNTNFVQGATTASFGAGITVNSLTVSSATSASANITIASTAASGARTVTLTTGSEVVSLPNGFTVTATPVLQSVTPNTGQAGETLSVTLVGANTNFVQATTTASFGAGVTVNSVTVNSSTSASANITIAANAALDARTVSVTTGSEVVSLANGFTVTAAPTLQSVTPNVGQAGQTLSVTLVGMNTHFAQGTTTANFGAGITVNTVSVNNSTSASANITIAANAALDARTVNVTTGSEVVSLTNGFTVTGAPALQSVTPNVGQAGQTLSVTLVGVNTHFLQGSTTASFGAGVTVNSVTVNSSTSASANISITANAALDARTVSVTTGSEVVSLTNGFTVTGAPALQSVTPNTAQAGQTLGITLVGVNTHFVQGSTTASFGAGVTVNSVTVNSSTSASANIAIAANAALAGRAVTVTTGSEVVSLTNGFTVTGAPALQSVTPNVGQAGQTLSVTLVGVNTNFVQGTTSASFGAGITVNSVTVNGSTSATANITVAPNAVIGARAVMLTTGSEVVSLINGFTVTSAPALQSVTPNVAGQGQTSANVAIVGLNTHFVQGTTVANFGAGITVNSLTVNSPTSATASVTVQDIVAVGPRTVTLTTGSEIASLINGFTITAPLDIVSFKVLFGGQSFDLAGSTRVRLPWQIAGIQVTFSRPVAQGSAGSLGGVNATGLTGLGTNTLTWSINPVSLGNLTLALSGAGPNALTDAAGNPLSVASRANRGLKILLGDFNDDGVVSSADLVGVNNATAAAYNPFADINGDGVVNINDVQLVRTTIGTSLQ